MCKNPIIIRNKRYMPTIKNDWGAKMEKLTDERKKLIQVPCGECDECRKGKGSSWNIRLKEEIKVSAKPYFVTLTFSDESLKHLSEELYNELLRKKDDLGFPRYDEKMAREMCKDEVRIVKLAVKRFRERWRKKYGTSIRHFLVTEKGHKGTERIHLHGILMQDNVDVKPTRNRIGTERANDEFSQKWGYGWVFTGHKVTSETIGYIMKYITKGDTKHKYFRPRTLCSPGIGKNLLFDYQKVLDIVRLTKQEGKYSIKVESGHIMALPQYFKMHIFDEKTRDQMFTERLDRKIYTVAGKEIRIECREDVKRAINALKAHRAIKTGIETIKSKYFKIEKIEEYIEKAFINDKTVITNMLKAGDWEGILVENFEKNAEIREKRLCKIWRLHKNPLSSYWIT